MSAPRDNISSSWNETANIKEKVGDPAAKDHIKMEGWPSSKKQMSRTEKNDRLETEKDNVRQETKEVRSDSKKSKVDPSSRPLSFDLCS
jgi:hypothetical protein